MNKLCPLQRSAASGYLYFGGCERCERDYCFLDLIERVEDEFNPWLEPILLVSKR